MAESLLAARVQDLAASAQRLDRDCRGRCKSNLTFEARRNPWAHVPASWRMIVRVVDFVPASMEASVTKENKHQPTSYTMSDIAGFRPLDDYLEVKEPSSLTRSGKNETKLRNNSQITYESSQFVPRTYPHLARSTFLEDPAIE